jgi:hypothetical protein
MSSASLAFGFGADFFTYFGYYFLGAALTGVYFFLASLGAGYFFFATAFFFCFFPL